MSDGKRIPRQTVILAAGNGTRLATLGHELPKPFLLVGGRTLIERALEQAQLAGCEEAVIVLGHEAEQFQRELARVPSGLRIQLVRNPQYNLPNGVSLLAAEPYVAERFFLQMADHVFSEPVLERLADPSLDGAARLLVDPAPVDQDELDATKVRIRDGFITAIGKEVRPYDAVDAGCFLLDRRVFAALRAVPGGAPSVSAGMEQLAAQRALAPLPLRGVAWVDVDTPADWKRAEAVLPR